MKLRDKKYNILVTGVGAIIGYGIIKSLRKSKYNCNIIGIDIYDDAAGRAWCDRFIRAIPACDIRYIDFVTDIINQYSIDLVFFGTEQELNKVSDSKKKLGSLYSKFVINRKEIIDLADDKWKTYNFLIDSKMNAIPSTLDDDYTSVCDLLGDEFLLKPRKSYAGKGIVKISDEESFVYYKNRIAKDNYMVQKIIGDVEHEYTASAFCFGDGNCIKPIIMRRKLSQEGATAKAWVIEEQEIEEYVLKIIEVLKPIGPTNFQFRKEGNKYYLLEINPRISSATSLRASFGYNESEMCIDWFLNGNRDIVSEIKKGYAIRYIEDMVILQ